MDVSCPSPCIGHHHLAIAWDGKKTKFLGKVFRVLGLKGFKTILKGFNGFKRFCVFVT